jgi:hypothetical protein
MAANLCMLSFFGYSSVCLHGKGTYVLSKALGEFFWAPYIKDLEEIFLV